MGKQPATDEARTAESREDETLYLLFAVVADLVSTEIIGERSKEDGTMKGRRANVLCLALLVLSFLAVPVQAQNFNATLSGTVNDPSGAGMSNAVVMLRSANGTAAIATDQERKLEPGLAPTPPMGWNSYDAYGNVVTEQQVKAIADYMAEHLSRYGYNYVVIDGRWQYADPTRAPIDREASAMQARMDDNGRFLPALNRFPSAAQGEGFKPLADYIHGKGLKFGIHIMRGIPRAAVQRNLPILGTDAHAQDVALRNDTCEWSKEMFGVDVSKPAGQAYYDSIVTLYAKWGVDFIKADDMSRGENPAGESYHGPEIGALDRAIQKAGRPILLSLSPGPTDPVHAEEVEQSAHMWRISDDFWDTWKQLKEQFSLCRPWAAYIGPDHWPDPDMIPLGHIRVKGYSDKDGPHWTRFTPAEQRTVMTLWSIFRSPLMIGSDLLSMDPATLALLTNDEVLAVDQGSTHNRELFAHGDHIAWAADIPGTDERYLAVFNLGDGAPAVVDVLWNDLGLKGKCAVRDLWEKKNLGTVENHFTPKVEAHGAGLYRIKPAK
jgi:hypothetical protein